MNVLSKRAWEERLLTVRLKPALGGTSIASVDSVVVVGEGADVTLSNITYATTSVTFLASGGNAGSYELRVRVFTDGTPTQRLEALAPFNVY